MYYTNTVYPEPPPYQETFNSNQAQFPPYPIPDREYNRNIELPGYSPQSNFDNQWAPPQIGHSVLPPIPVVDSIPTPIPAEPSGFTSRGQFTSEDILRGFLRKVYAIVFLQLLATIGIVSIFTFVPEVREFFQNRVYMIFVFGGVVLVVYCVISYSKAGRKLQRKSPQNICVIALVALLMGVFTGSIASFFNTEAVIFAFVISAVTCMLISLLSLSKSFSLLDWCGGYLAITLLILIVFAIVSAATYQQTWYLQVVWGFIAAFIFGIFLAYDTNQLIDDEDNEISEEDYVMGALRIYIDVVLLFIIILVCCFGGGGGQ